MASAVDLRSDFDGHGLRRIAPASKDRRQVRRLLALAAIYDGGSRSEAARIGGVGLEIMRDWGVRFNDRGPNGLIDGKAPGALPLLSVRRAAPRVASCGRNRIDPGIAWCGPMATDRLGVMDLGRVRALDQPISKQTPSRKLRGSGYRKLSARPRHHTQDADAIPASNKNFPAQLAAIRATLSRGTPVEIGWQDEARVSQKNGITRRWARGGTRPSPPKDQRTKSAYFYGAICPDEGQAAGLVLPRCNTEGMRLHLAGIPATVAPGAHAVLLLDRAGWRGSNALIVPPNIMLMPLPSKCPKLNPVENIWLVYARQLVFEPDLAILRGLS